MYLLFYYGFFKDLARSSACVTLNEGMDGEQWIVKDVEGSCLDLIWFTISTFLAVTEVNRELGQDFNVVNLTGKNMKLL
jgi:hypothetical protein